MQPDRLAWPWPQHEAQALLERLRPILTASEVFGGPLGEYDAAGRLLDALIQRLRGSARMKQLAPGWHRRDEAPGVPRAAEHELLPPSRSLEPAPRRERAVIHIQTVTEDVVIGEVHRGPAAPEMLELPIAIFRIRPRVGERIEVALQPLPFSSQPEHTKAEPSPLDQAYDELDALLAERHVQGPNPELEVRVEAAWAHLRELQEAARAKIGQELDEALELPPSKLKRIIEEARSLLAEDS